MLPYWTEGHIIETRGQEFQIIISYLSHLNIFSFNYYKQQISRILYISRTAVISLIRALMSDTKHQRSSFLRIIPDLVNSLHAIYRKAT